MSDNVAKPTTKFVKVPSFAMTQAQRPPAVAAPHSDKNPTIGGLFSATDRSAWVDHRVPLIETTLKVMFEPIFLNKQKYEPGKVYHVPPDVDAELTAAEARYVGSIGRQITGNDFNGTSVQNELEAQKAFDLRRRAREAAGVAEAVA